MVTFLWSVQCALAQPKEELQNRVLRFESYMDSYLVELENYTQILERSKQRGGNDKPFIVEDLVSHSPNLILEAQIRTNEISKHQVLNAIEKALDSKLVDRALWKLIQSPKYPLFSYSEKGEFQLQEVSKLLKKRPDLFWIQQPKGHWWKYFLERRFDEKAFGVDEDYRIWSQFHLSKTQKFPALLGSYLELRSELIGSLLPKAHLKEFDQSFQYLLWNYYQKRWNQFEKDILQASRENILDGNSLKIFEQKIFLLNQISVLLKEKKLFEAAFSVSMTSLDLRKRMAKNIDWDEIFEIAEESILAKRPEETLSLLESYKSDDKSALRMGRLLELRAQAHEMMADQFKSQKIYHLEWAAEYYRKSLNQLISSDDRDDLLRDYARVLGRLGLKNAEMGVLESLFRGGSDRDSQIQALVEYLAKSEGRFQSEKDSKLRLKLFLSHLSLLSQFSRAHPKNSSVDTFYANSKRTILKDKLSENPEVLASLYDIENVLNRFPRTFKTNLNKKSDSKKKKRVVQ